MARCAVSNFEEFLISRFDLTCFKNSRKDVQKWAKGIDLPHISVDRGAQRVTFAIRDSAPSLARLPPSRLPRRRGVQPPRAPPLYNIYAPRQLTPLAYLRAEQNKGTPTEAKHADVTAASERRIIEFAAERLADPPYGIEIKKNTIRDVASI
ncbi:hypothetical protein EVAR_51584_1 [Eumeta japonica]|uniref:Uncharacterized protein n=1 Tax=Eumeta variegata TaxID=151549 RepID=A0A4C1YJ51_EUMVA|nr:hypothetical protein EVAR_51584_1 [Eumeta japonica]